MLSLAALITGQFGYQGIPSQSAPPKAWLACQTMFRQMTITANTNQILSSVAFNAKWYNVPMLFDSSLRHQDCRTPLLSMW